MKKTPLIVVCGPTASGKTSLAIEIAKKYDGEVVSADSMQIYRTMDIATAKPTENEMQGIKHHMIDVCDITDNFSVSDYCTAAHKIIEDIVQRGKTPILCGGTGLYIDSLVEDLDFSQSNENSSVREELLKRARENPHELYEELSEKDFEAANSIHENNVKRVVRALEHIYLTGEKFSEYKRKAAEKESRYNPLFLMIDWDRGVLYDRINRRVDIMVHDGLLEEARRIYDLKLPESLTSLSSIGYKELFDYFDGKCSLDDALALIKQSSRRYAKRQLTWFRRNKRIKYVRGIDDAEKIIEEWQENGEI